MTSNLQKMYQTAMRENSSVKINTKTSTNENEKSNRTDLLNIIRSEMTTPSVFTCEPPSTTSTSKQHIGIQCDANLLKLPNSSSDQIRFGHLTRELNSTTTNSIVHRRSGQIDVGIQVEFCEDSILSLKNLIEIYSNRLSEETIKQFYEICQEDLIWTRQQLDEYLQHSIVSSTIPTLRQLSFNALNQWDVEIKSSNPSFDTISIGDLLEDLNDEDVFVRDNENSSLEFNETSGITISSTLVHSLQNSYGEIPQLNSIISENNCLVLPLDDPLSVELHRALQRFVGITNVPKKMPMEKKSMKDIRKTQQSQWIAAPTNSKSLAPSLKDIMNEELNHLNTQKTPQKRQLDFASQHKLKDLEKEFSSFSSEVLYEIFRENEFDLDLTRVCILSMLDEDVSIRRIETTTTTPPQSSPRRTKFDSNSHQIHRKRAEECALKRKEFYTKANQANRHGMTGVASYYINQAREQTLQMKDENRNASEQLTEQRLNEFRQKHRLDLHELYADEALELFKRVENEMYDGIRRTTSVSIEVITGYGKGSMYGGGCGKIRSVIIAYLKQKKYKYTEPNRGAILVQFGNAR